MNNRIAPWKTAHHLITTNAHKEENLLGETKSENINFSCQFC